MNILNKHDAQPLQKSAEESDGTQLREKQTLLGSGKTDIGEEVMLKPAQASVCISVTVPS